MAYRPDSNGCGITKKRKRTSDQVISELDHDEMDIDSSTAPTVENSESFKRGVPRDKAVPFDVNTIVARQADAHLVHETAPSFEFFSNTVTFTHNLSRTTPKGFGLIPSPSLPQTISHGDSLTVISEKLRKLINYGLQTGRSLAMATDFLTVDQLKELDPIGNAIASLDFRERDFWDAYCNAVHGITDDIQAGSLDLITKVPVPDWSEPEVQLAIADPKSPARKSFERRALALKFLYKTPQTVTAENGRWFTMTHVDFLPLVKAVDRLHAGIKLQKCTRERAKVHMLNKEISFLKSVIQSVELILHRRVMGLASSRLSSYDPSSDAKRRKFSSASSTNGSISTISTSGTSTNVGVAENNVTYDQPATKANIRHCLSVLRERVKELEAENVKVCVEVNSYIRRPWTERQNDVLKQLKVFSGRNADDDGMYAD